MGLAVHTVEPRQDRALPTHLKRGRAPLPTQRILELQRLAGNAAVADLIALQRCGPTTCGCPDDVQREALAGLQPLAGNQAVSELVAQRAAEPAAANSLPGTAGVVPAAGAAACGVPAECGPPFCVPYANQAIGYAVRQASENTLLAGIAYKVSPRVVPYWYMYLHGGTSPLDLSGTFGPDFTSSKRTAEVTDFLMTELEAELINNPPMFPAGANETTIDLGARLGTAMTSDIGQEGGRMPMNFFYAYEIPGNIAGGIGTDQLTCQVGAQPSPFNDHRSAAGSARIIKNPDGTLTAIPSITFTVRDTIDLCPGNCGAELEQIATVPLSRLEASGIAGDVPFTVRFPAPRRSLKVMPAAPPPSPKPSVVLAGLTTASSLHIRKSPSTSSPIVGNYPRGSRISVLCETEGTNIEGNSTWDQTDRGFVSDRYVRHLDGGAPPACL